MRSSLKTGQVISDQSELSSKSMSDTCSLLKQLNNHINDDNVKQTNKLMTSLSPDHSNILFFKPNLFNLFNLIGLIICLSFCSRINQLEKRIYHLEQHCQNELDNRSFQRKIVSKTTDYPVTEEAAPSLPVSIVKFVDQRIESSLAHNRTKRDLNHCNCPPGPPGKRGKKGEVGPIGPGGAVGFPGPMGEKGEKGDSGIDVFTTTKNGVKRSVTRLQGGSMGYAEFIAIKGLANLGITISPGDLLLLKGEPGPKGEPGHNGEKGDKGEIGQIGEPGPLGPTGFIGPKGDKGERGLTTTMDGNTFPTGFIEGPPGPPGPPGKKGATGTPGLPGAKGDKGEQGRGKRGRKGAPGKDGKSGDKGDKGICGQNADLFKGEPGEIGRPGMIGTPGMPGPPGQKGDKGDSSSLNAARLEQLPPAGYLKDYAGSSEIQLVAGPPGLPGEQGKLGMPGPRGKDGEKGERGQHCIMAPKGQKGDPGMDAPCPLDPEGMPLKGCGYNKPSYIKQDTTLKKLAEVCNLTDDQNKETISFSHIPMGELAGDQASVQPVKSHKKKHKTRQRAIRHRITTSSISDREP